MWYHYFEGVDAVIFVVDSNDTARIQEAQDELFGIMNHQLLRNAKLIVYANKQDLPESMSTSQVIEKLNLQTRFRNVDWHVEGTVATTGSGLYEGLDWLNESFYKRPVSRYDMTT